MNETTSALIEKLAEKLGTTAEHLWEVLLRQAPISGTVDLVTCVLMVSFAVFLVRMVIRKTTTPAPTDANRYPKAEWIEEGAGLAWLAVFCYVVITVVCVIGSINGIAAAFLNPEYWALSQILGKL